MCIYFSNTFKDRTNPGNNIQAILFKLRRTIENDLRINQTMKKTTLYIFSGLPGTGKSTLAQMLSKHLSATYIRIDILEHYLSQLFKKEILTEGYELGYQIAKSNLSLGIDVVADSCNPIFQTRQAWHDICIQSNAHYLDIETICSDTDEHQSRIQTRNTDIPGFTLPSWNDVLNRDHETWAQSHVQIDTANTSAQKSFNMLLEQINQADNNGISE